MTTLFSLIVVYLLQKYLGRYVFFQNLEKSCSFYWVEDLLFKYQMLVNKFPKIPVMAAAGLLILLIGIGMLLLQLIFYYSSYNLGLILFNIVLLFYCLSSVSQKNYSSIFVTAFEHMFGILFWFTILGPVGLVLFWLFTIGGTKANKLVVTATEAEITKQTNVANAATNTVITDFNVANQVYHSKDINNCLFTLHTIAAWLPARITGLIFSLIGDFKQGFGCWKEIMKNSNITHTEFLDRCGDAALGNSNEDRPELLIERSFVAWLIVCIVISLIL